jgi:hypothetical protein
METFPMLGQQQYIGNVEQEHKHGEGTLPTNLRGGKQRKDADNNNTSGI